MTVAITEFRTNCYEGTRRRKRLYSLQGMQRVFPEMTVFVLDLENQVKIKAVRKVGIFTGRNKS